MVRLPPDTTTAGPVFVSWFCSVTPVPKVTDPPDIASSPVWLPVFFAEPYRPSNVTFWSVMPPDCPSTRGPISKSFIISLWSVAPPKSTVPSSVRTFTVLQT
jgi:hypothetical protein